MKLMIPMLAALVALPTVAHAKPIEDTQGWATISATGPIAGDFVFQVEGQSRIIDNVGRYGQTQLRGAAGVKVDPNLTLFVGYVHQDTKRAGARDGIEDRLYQQASLKLGNALGGSLATRIRLEQRFIRGASGTSLRYRQQVRYQKPFHKDGPALIVASEIFFTLNSITGGPRGGFDQLRGLVGVFVPVSKAVSIEAGYQAVYVNGTPRDRLNHTFPIVLAIKL